MLRRMFLIVAALVCVVGCADIGSFSFTTPVNPAVSSEVANWDVGRKVLVFSVPECYVCNEERPLVEKMRRKAIPQGVGVVEVNARDYPELAAHFGVKQYPTYVLCENGEVCRDANGMPAVALSLKTCLKLLKLVFFIVMFFI